MNEKRMKAPWKCRKLGWKCYKVLPYTQERYNLEYTDVCISCTVGNVSAKLYAASMKLKLYEYVKYQPRIKRTRAISFNFSLENCNSLHCLRSFAKDFYRGSFDFNCVLTAYGNLSFSTGNSHCAYWMDIRIGKSYQEFLL